MKKYILLGSIALALHLHAYESDFEKYKNSFQHYKKAQKQQYFSYKEAQEKAYNDYKTELKKFWNKPKLTTRKELVTYTEDKKTRTTVDFKEQKLTVEVLASSQKEADEKLKIALAKAVTVDTKTFYETDPLEKKLSSIKKNHSLVKTSIKKQAIISNVIFEKKPTKKELTHYVDKHLNDKYMKIKKSDKIKDKKVYTLNIPLPSDTTLKLSRQYLDNVKKYSKLQKIPIALTFAIMQTESSFNPLARSHIPAYGLMQIVPKTAGIDSYYYLYKTKKLVSGSYLYDSHNNIRMGTAYLHILYYKYLRHIKDPKTRLYCTIAAYNTGAGNIAWAFTHTYNIKKAAPYINALSAQEVYKHLLKNLKFDEPKRYLVKVTKRMDSYQQVYGM